MNESGEMYLKDIYFLKSENNKIRSIDIAKRRNVSRAGVSKAVGILKEKALITIDGNGLIDITDEGIKYVLVLIDKCKIISWFLKENLDIDKCVACENACKYEHVITDDCYLAMKKKYEEMVK